MENTSIGWCDHTANFWRGCSHAKYTGQRIMGKSVWSEVRKWNRKAGFSDCCNYAVQNGACSKCFTPAKRPRVFVSSMSDIFEEFDPVVDHNGATLHRVPSEGHAIKPVGLTGGHAPRLTLDDLRGDVFKLISECQNLDFLLTTKRPQNIERLASPWISTMDLEHFSNVWILVSVSDQPTLEWALRELAKQPKWWKYTCLSVEPMLGSIDFHAACVAAECSYLTTIDWCIIGGESTQQFPARPFPVDHAKLLVEQCKAAGIPCFFKQFGSNPVTNNFLSVQEEWPVRTVTAMPFPNVDNEPARIELRHPKGENIDEWPEWARVQQFPGE